MPETVTPDQSDARRGEPAELFRSQPSAAGAPGGTSPVGLPRARYDADAPPYTGPLQLPLTDAWLEELMRSGSETVRQVPASYVPPTPFEETALRPWSAAVPSRAPVRPAERRRAVTRVAAAVLIALALVGAALVIRGDIGGFRVGATVPPVNPSAAPPVAPASPTADAASPPAPVTPAPTAQPADPNPPAAGQPGPGQPAPTQAPSGQQQPPPAPPAAEPAQPVIVGQSVTPGQIGVRGCPVDQALVEARISSNSELTSVRLLWVDLETGVAQVVPMRRAGDTWVGRIGPSPTPGSLFWKVEARDGQNRLGTGPTARLPVRPCFGP